jgi:uncharacterized tellurite resistance protein B-like protein
VWAEFRFSEKIYPIPDLKERQTCYLKGYQPQPLMKFQEILQLFRQGKGSARSHMKNLIEMAAVDGNFDEAEFDLLKTIAKRNGISEGQLKEIRQNPGGIVFEIPTDSREKFHQMYDLVHMMTVDNAVHSEELKLCNLFAIKFGYPRDRVKELIETLKGNIQHGQTPDEAMKRAAMMIA